MPVALIGRTRELDDLESRVRESRLVTIVGSGGVGKTALAAAVADRVVDRFPLGVRQVDLTRVEDPAAVPGAIAAQLGFDSFGALLASPVDQPALLVVDNCEHLLDATAHALLRMLGACLQPCVVATSRSPLDLPGESVMSLAPLALPKAGDDARASASVALFLQRCRDAGTEIADSSTDDVVELCRRLDGLPLALEIAAARTRTMTIAEISARLDENVDVLDRPRFRGDPRHRSVSATIRWSHDLLDPSPARLFEQLGVFVGPFTAASARAVAGDVEAFDADLDELVHASLVVVDTTGDDAQYRLLDTVRRFARARLDARAALGDAYGRFVDHVISRSRALLSGAASSWRPGLLKDLVASYDDVAEALRWCIAHDETPRRAHELCTSLWAIVHQGHAEDINELMRRMVARFPETDTPGGAQARAVLATSSYVTGDPAAAVALATTTLADHPGADLTSITLRRVLGQARSATGDREGAIAAFREGARIGHELGMTAMAQELEVAAAIVGADIGQVEAGIAELDAILEAARGAGSAITASWAWAARSWLVARIDPAAALVEAAAALAEARAIDYPIAVAVDLRTIAFAHLLLGDSRSAAATVNELLDDLLDRGALSNLRILADVAAALAYSCGLPEWQLQVATARALPITTLACSQFEPIAIPAVEASLLSTRAVIDAVRATVLALDAERMEPIGTSDPLARPSMRTRGDLCEIEFDGRTISVRMSKGVSDIVRLVEAGGREVHCTELAGVAVEQSATGAVIDARARREYEERIRELQVDIDEAETRSDFARVYTLQVEFDAIVDHLTASLGRGHRTRQGTDNTERARSAVAHRVRSTIRQLAKVHPSLGRHFGHSINTGGYCSYRPETPVAWVIE